MKISNICTSYFNGFNNISSHKGITNKSNILGILKVISYLTLIIPLGFAGLYACDLLYGRFTKKKQRSPTEKTINQLATEKIDSAQKKKPKAPTETIPARLNISGRKLLNNSQIHLYFRYLSTEFPHLFLHKLGTYITHINDRFTNYPTLIEDAILFDGHFNKNNECFHDEEDEIDCTDINILAYPIHVSNNHWTLALVDRQKRTIEYYDSMSGPNTHKTDLFKELASKLSKFDLKNPPYKFVNKVEKTLQFDGYQCGIWILYFLENRLRNPDFNFNNIDTSICDETSANFRLKVQQIIVEQNEKIEIEYRKRITLES